MKRIRRKAGSILLTAAMFLSLFPTGALAADPEEVPPQEAPPQACTCTVLCTEDATDTQCPVCAGDIANCTATAAEPQEPEQPQVPEQPECTCTVRCTEEYVDAQCPVCADDIANCAGTSAEPLEPEQPQQPEQPECTCTVRCTEDATDTQCPVCTDNIANCTAAAAEPQEPSEPAEVMELYVSSSGSDSNPGTTSDKPFASLHTAVAAVPADGTATIYVMSDLTMDQSVRYWGAKDITITSDPASLDAAGKTAFTISRTEGDFTAVNDQARGGYNPGLFELGNGANLTLTHIILDDRHVAYSYDGDGPYFIQVDASRGDNPKDEPQPGSTTVVFTENKVQVEKEVDNHYIVQDAMITSFDANSTITLGAGAVLQNYGGMSAVRIANATLIMEDDSIIQDTDDFKRIKGEAGSTGPAGAVWIQSGKLIMEDKAEICHMNGRAIYADGKGSSVTVYGKIHNLTGNSAMWGGVNGVAMHLRNYSDADWYGEISDINCSSGSGSAAYVTVHSELRMHQYAQLHDVTSGMGIQVYGNQGSTLYMDGEITRCGNSAIHMNCDSVADPALKPQGNNVLKVTIGSNGDIHHNTGGYGNVTMQTYNATLDVYGKIRDNYAGPAGIGMAWNHDTTTVTLHRGAQITGNVSSGSSGVTVAKGTVIMEEGAIVSGNISTGGTAGVTVDSGGTFIMNGGIIENNISGGQSSGVSYVSAAVAPAGSKDYPNQPSFQSLALLNQGTISGNKANATVTVPEDKTDVDSYLTEGGEYRDLVVSTTTSSCASVKRYMTISDDMVIGNENVYFAKYGFTLVKPSSDVKFGNTSVDCETKVTDEFASQNLTEVVASLWYQSDKPSYLTTINGLQGAEKYNPDKDLYAAVLATDEEGKPAADAKVTLQVVEWDENNACHLVLPGQGNGYAVVFIQEKDLPAQIVKITPADMTIYMGGDDGYEGVVGGESGTGTASNSMPTPLFSVDAFGTSAEQVVLSGADGREWKFKAAGTDSDGTPLYYMTSTGTVGGAPQDPVRVTFTGIDGKFHLNDSFVPTDVEELFANYAINIYRGSAGTVTAKIGGVDYLVATGTGMLTVRAVAKQDPTSDIIAVEDLKKVDPGKAVAVASPSTTYTLNDTGVPVATDAKPSLLFDSIIDDAAHNRTGALAKKVDEKLGAVSSGKVRNYEIMYLDLVDANNGNAWISSSEGVDIYWGYPANTSMNTSFTILHFPGLHRDGNNSGYDVEDINQIAVDNIQPITIEKTADGLKFHVGKGGFSPFALIWESDKSVDPTPNPNPDADDDFTLHYVTNGGKHLSAETKSQRWTKAYEDLPTPERDGYTFLGWYWDLRLTDPVRGDVEVNNTTVNIYAKWEAEGTVSGSGDVSGWLDTVNHKAYLRGYPTQAFCPDRAMTRSEVAQMFYALLLDQDVEITASFTDVPAEAQYAKAVRTLASLGMMSGYPDGTFRPTAPITRAEFAAMALAFAQQGSGASSSYQDVSRNDWFYPYVSQASAYGWIGGYPDNTFRPNNPITRAEVCVIVNNMLGRDADERFIDQHDAELVSFGDLAKNHWAYYDVMEATNSHKFSMDNSKESWTRLITGA